jgi:hypothetical protein
MYLKIRCDGESTVISQNMLELNETFVLLLSILTYIIANQFHKRIKHSIYVLIYIYINLILLRCNVHAYLLVYNTELNAPVALKLISVCHIGP